MRIESNVPWENPGTATIPQYWLNKTRKHKHRASESDSTRYTTLSKRVRASIMRRLKNNKCENERTNRFGWALLGFLLPSGHTTCVRFWFKYSSSGKNKNKNQRTTFATENLRYLVTNVKIDAVERTLHPLIATHTTLFIWKIHCN